MILWDGIPDFCRVLKPPQNRWFRCVANCQTKTWCGHWSSCEVYIKQQDECSQSVTGCRLEIYTWLMTSFLGIYVDSQSQFLERKHLLHVRGGLTTACLDFSQPLRDGGVLPCFGCKVGSPCPWWIRRKNCKICEANLGSSDGYYKI